MVSRVKHAELDRLRDQKFESGSLQRRVIDELYRGVAFADFGERLGAAAFERMRRTEVAGERQPVGEPIDGDDRIAARVRAAIVLALLLSGLSLFALGR